jgi:hypothetical protein
MRQLEIQITLLMLSSVPKLRSKLTIGFSFKGEVREPFPKVIEVCFSLRMRLTSWH